MVEKNKQNQGFVDSDRQCNHQKLNKFTEQGYYFHEWYPFSVVFRSHISEAWNKPQAQKTCGFFVAHFRKEPDK